VANCVLRSSGLARAAPRVRLPFPAAAVPRVVSPAAGGSRRPLVTTTALSKGLSPESEDPPPPAPEDSQTTATPAPITEDEYHELADDCLEAILGRFEELQDEREELDVEFSAGVMTISLPEIGSYVINKQPPNKQIWLSSPKSGPKRYDWVIFGDGQNQKEGTGMGQWIYLRDGSSLNDVFMEEIGVDLSLPTGHYGE